MDFFSHLETQAQTSMEWSQCRLMVGTRVLVSTHPRLLQAPLWEHFDELWNEASFRLMCVETFCCTTQQHEICTSDCYPSIENFLGAWSKMPHCDAIDAVGTPGRIVEPITITVVKRSDRESELLTVLRPGWQNRLDTPQLPWIAFNRADLDLICTSKELVIAALRGSCAGVDYVADELKTDRMVGSPST